MTTIRLVSLRLSAAFSSAAKLSPYVRVTYFLIAVGFMVTALLISIHPMVAALAAAILCGWSEVDGLCGTSHVCTISPLRLMSPRDTLWLKAVSAYTVGGLVTGACAGALLGTLGQVVLLNRSYVLYGASMLIAALALVLAAREFNLVRFRLPQVYRQTQKIWAVEYGVVTASAMWGSHIGLGFATVVQHGGFFVLVLFAGVLGPVKGALVMAAYWFGRTLPLWFARALSLDQCNAPELMRLLLVDRAVYRYAAAAGLVCTGLIALKLAM